MPEQMDKLNQNNLPELNSRIGKNENAELLTILLLDTQKVTQFSYLIKR